MPGVFGSGNSCRIFSAIGLIMLAGIWLFGELLAAGAVRRCP